MLDFHPITESSVSVIAPYLYKNSSRFCDFTTVDLFVWSGRFYEGYAIQDNMLFLQLCAYDHGAPLYAPPIGDGDFSVALLQLRAHCSERGEPLRLSLCSEEQLPAITQTLGSGWRATAYRDWCDYLYDAKAMASYEGKAYAKQRNHLRRFERLYPSARIEELSETHFEAIEAFLAKFAASRDTLNDLAMEEIALTKYALEHKTLLGLFGTVLYVDDVLVGFSAGCRSNDTLFVNFEKADVTYEGVYQMLVKAFAQRYVDESILYINREEDCGVEGLRRSKLAYHPLKLLGKYTLAFDG